MKMVQDRFTVGWEISPLPRHFVELLSGTEWFAERLRFPRWVEVANIANFYTYPPGEVAKKVGDVAK